MKKLFTLLFSLFVLLTFTQRTHAVTIESQSEKSSEIQTFIVLADTNTRSTAVQLRLEVEGGVITSFSAGDDGLLSIGVCDEKGAKYTSTSICVDIANVSGVFEDADVLGVFTVERDDNYTQLKVMKSEDNAYMTSGGDFEEDSGQAFVLFGGSTTTKTSDNENEYGYLFLFLLLAFLTGVVFGTTFTTLGHVLQAGKLHQKRAKKD
jgi:hypothetical protein